MKQEHDFICVRCKKQKKKYNFYKNGAILKACDDCRIKSASRQMAREQYSTRECKLSTDIKVHAYNIFLTQNRHCKICKRLMTIKSACVCWAFDSLVICCFFCSNLAEDFDMYELQEFMQERPFQNVHIHNIHKRGKISCKLRKRISGSLQIVGHKRKIKQ